MTMAVELIFVPVPVPVVSGGMGWERRSPPPPYPRDHRERFPVRQAIPVHDQREVRRMIADAKRMLAEQRAAKLLRESGGR
jgi:hypothetical protein